jgi:hypothetical protein
MNKNSLLFGIYCAPLAFILIGIGWAGFAGFVPPPLPTTSAAEIANIFANRHTGILFGCVLTAFAAGGPFLVFVATISAFMTRMERGLPILTFAQLVCGLFTGIVMMVSAMVWIAAAFRPERAPDLIQSYNDFAWLFVLSPFSFGVLQNCVIGIAILGDKSTQPLFPRWVAYFNFWTAFLYCPAGLIPFFMAGPFAWNGLLSFWLVLVVFGAWTVIMPWAMLQALKRLPAAIE